MAGQAALWQVRLRQPGIIMPCNAAPVLAAPLSCGLLHMYAGHRLYCSISRVNFTRQEAMLYAAGPSALSVHMSCR